MFLENSQFPFVTTLETHWSQIRQELEQLQQSHFMPWPETALYNSGWDVFGLYAFGRKLASNCQLCPATTELIEQVPGMITAGFSCLAPGTHIAPHIGYTNTVLRCHLGLIVPVGCALRVGTETRPWQEGKCFIFDDTVEHEAWHHGSSPRIVLLLDFKRTADAHSQPEIPSTVAATIAQLTR
jgi:ornithine lipid ester-linked acyl 2-hydroxylase